MDYYKICSELISLPQTEPIGGISNLISLSKNRIWIYFCNGTTQYWDLCDYTLKAPKLINTLKIPAGLYHSFALSYDKIAFYDHIAQRLKVIRLAENKIDTNFWSMLPTNNTIGNSERNDERKIEEICRDYTKFCALTTSETIVTLEKTMINSNASDSVISIFRESHCPEPFKQKIHNSHSSTIATLNTEDTIIIYQITSEKVHTFYIWNVFLDEKNIRKIVIKNDLSATIIKTTNYGIGKFAIWMNVKESGTPEVGIVDYDSIPDKDKKEKEVEEYEMERKPISYFKEDWILQDVIFFDVKKEIFLIAKCGDMLSFELMNIKTFKSFFSRNAANCKEDVLDFSQSPSLDNKYYVEYISVMGGDTEDDELDKSNGSLENESLNKMMSVNVFCNNIVPLRISLLSILEKMKILEKYGSFLANEMIDMLTLPEK